MKQSIKQTEAYEQTTKLPDDPHLGFTGDADNDDDGYTTVPEIYY